MTTIIYDSPRKVINSARSLVEIELAENEMPLVDDSNFEHVATITMKRKGKAARFFVRVGIETDNHGYEHPVCRVIALRQDRDHNSYNETIGRFTESLRESIQRQEDEREKTL